jgi:hypothetical protein
MAEALTFIPSERLVRSILLIRGEKVMLDYFKKSVSGFYYLLFDRNLSSGAEAKSRDVYLPLGNWATVPRA